MITDKDIYDWIDCVQGANTFGNENLRRDIQRMVGEFREGLKRLGKIDPPMPKEMLEKIKTIIGIHKKPPKISDILQLATHECNSNYPFTDYCVELSYRAGLLSKSHLWTTPHESLRAVDNWLWANEEKRKIIDVLILCFKLFARYQSEHENHKQMIAVFARRLQGIAKKFGKKRHYDVTPFPRILTTTAPMHPTAIEIQERANKQFQANLREFKDVCESMIGQEDSNNTIQQMQAFTDFLVNSLEWEIYGSPRFLAPATLQDSIQIAYTVSKEPQNFEAQFGDLMFTTLWYSNVLALPNPGHDVMRGLEELRENL